MTIRWHDADNVAVLVDGRLIWSAGDSNDFPDEAPLGPARIAASAAEGLARALRVPVTIERPGQ